MDDFTRTVLPFERAVKGRVETWLAQHDPMDWPNLRHPSVRACAAQACAAEAAGDLVAVGAAWADWEAAVWAQVPAEERPAQRCRSCSAPVWWGVTAKGKPCPFDLAADGERTTISHFTTCPQAGQWSKRGAA